MEVTGQLQVAGIDLGLVPARLGHTRLQVVGDGGHGDPAICLVRPDVGEQPGLQVLATGGLHVEQPAAAEDRDEDLHLGDLAGGGVDEGHPVAGEVDEEPLPGGVLEAHHHVLPSQPLVVAEAELAVPPPIGMALSPLQPEQAEGDVPAPLQLAMHLPPVGDRPAREQGGAGWREQLRLDLRRVQLGGQRPAQPRRLRPAQVLVDGRPPEAGASSDLRDVEARGLEPQHLADLAHG